MLVKIAFELPENLKNKVVKLPKTMRNVSLFHDDKRYVQWLETFLLKTNNYWFESAKNPDGSTSVNYAYTVIETFVEFNSMEELKEFIRFPGTNDRLHIFIDGKLNLVLSNE